MTKRPLSIVLLGLVGAPASARADDAAATAATELAPFFNQMPSLRDSPAERMHASLPDPKKCRAAIQAARKAGLADDARIYSSQLAGWDETHYDKERQAYLTLAESSAVCDDYAELVLMIPAAAAQADAAQTYATYSTIDPKSLGKDMGQSMIDVGQACLIATDDAIAAGAPADRKTRIGERELTLADGRTELCQTLIDFGERLGGDIADAHAAERDKIAAKYVKAGIKGERLEVFIENDNTYWRVKGCGIETDLKKLKKAKKLYQLWESPDGTYSIRTYTFKGNKVKSIKNRAYATLEKAEKGCR